MTLRPWPKVLRDASSVRGSAPLGWVSEASEMSVDLSFLVHSAVLGGATKSNAAAAPLETPGRTGLMLAEVGRPEWARNWVPFSGLGTDRGANEVCLRGARSN